MLLFICIVLTSWMLLHLCKDKDEESGKLFIMIFHGCYFLSKLQFSVPAASYQSALHLSAATRHKFRGKMHFYFIRLNLLINNVDSY